MNPKFEDFEIDFRNPLGESGNGNVYKAIEKKTGNFMQLKDIQLKI